MKILKLLPISAYLALANASSVYAQDRPSSWIDGIGQSPTGVTSIPQLIQKVLNFAIGFAVVVCVVILIFAGYQYMTAGGDENKISTATKSLTWAIVGLVVCFIAVLLVKFVGDTILGQGTI